ncbi:ABC transporter permease [Rhizobium panacihumi]|uniref:ABC transporter permease n=1 Tax=Rhizobium panacihumi TaxID=2008450 RepID=UPI003D7A7052
MRHSLSLYLHLMRMQVRTRLQYRANLVIGWVAQAFGYASTYGTIWIIASRFEKIGGWTWPEIALMLGFHTLAYSLGALFTLVQLRAMEELVRHGTYDTLLVRPVSPWAFLVFSGINIEYGGHVSLGIGMIVWALFQLGLDWSVVTVLQFALSLVSAALLSGAMLTAIAALALVLTRSRYLFGLYFDFLEMSRYPLAIFAMPLQFLLLSIVPLGFMGYVPVAALLGKPVPFIGDAAPFAAILAGPLMVVVAMLVWQACQRRYQGAGG